MRHRRKKVAKRRKKEEQDRIDAQFVEKTHDDLIEDLSDEFPLKKKK